MQEMKQSAAVRKGRIQSWTAVGEVARRLPAAKSRLDANLQPSKHDRHHGPTNRREPEAEYLRAGRPREPWLRIRMRHLERVKRVRK